MTTPFDPSALLAEIAEADAAEAAALAERQRRRRESLAPAAEVAAEIARTRAEFLAADADRLAQLSAALKEAKKHGAPADRLAQLRTSPLIIKPCRAASTNNRPGRKSRSSTDTNHSAPSDVATEIAS